MVAAADVMYVDGTIHPDVGADETAEAIAVRDGIVRRVADTYEVEFLQGIETQRIDLDGRTVVPGFVDGGSDLRATGQGLGGDAIGSEGPANAVRESVQAGIDHATANGVTSVFETITDPKTARVYHELAAADELPLRVDFRYLQRPDGRFAGEREAPDFLSALRTLGLESGVDTGMGQPESVLLDVASWDEDALGSFLETATAAGVSVMARISDRTGLESVVAARESGSVDFGAIFLDTVPSEELIGPLTDLDRPIVVGPTAQQAEQSSVGRLLAAGIPVQFGSDGGSIRPLRAIAQATGGSAQSRLGTTEALQAATGGTPRSARPSASLEPGQPADFVVLSGSPWETPPAALTVEMTVVDGQVVYKKS